MQWIHSITEKNDNSTFVCFFCFVYKSSSPTSALISVVGAGRVFKGADDDEDDDDDDNCLSAIFDLEDDRGLPLVVVVLVAVAVGRELTRGLLRVAV